MKTELKCWSVGVLVACSALLPSLALGQVTVNTVPIYNSPYYPWHQSMLSRDGSVVVGASPYTTFPPEKWSLATGVVDLSKIGTWVNEVKSINGNGSVFLGTAIDLGSAVSPRVIYYANAWHTLPANLFLQSVSFDGMTGLGTQQIGTNSQNQAIVQVVSYSLGTGGTAAIAGPFVAPNVFAPIIYGDAKLDAFAMMEAKDTSGQRWNFWNKAKGLQYIVPAGYNSADLCAISPDGTAVAGQAYKGDLAIHAFVWSSVFNKFYDLGSHPVMMLSNGAVAVLSSYQQPYDLWSPGLGFAHFSDMLIKAGYSSPGTAHALQLSDDATVVLSLPVQGGYQDDQIIVPSLMPPFDSGTFYNVKAGTPFSVSSPGLMSFVSTKTAATISLVRAPLHAKSFSLSSNGAFNYTPADGFIGTDSFTFKATNFGGDGNAATVRLFVQ